MPFRVSHLLSVAYLLAMSWLFNCSSLSAQTISQSADSESDKALLSEVESYLNQVSNGWNTQKIGEFLNVDALPSRLKPFALANIADEEQFVNRFEELTRLAPEDIGLLAFDLPKITDLGEGMRVISSTWRLTRNQQTSTGEFVIGVQEDDQWTVSSGIFSLGEVLILKKPAVRYGWASLIPPLLAIALAIVTRRVLVSLFFGILVGCGMLAGSNGVTTLTDLWWWFISSLNLLCESFLWAILIDEDRQRILWFVVLMGAMVGIVHRSGGMHGIVDLLKPLTRSRRGGQVVTWFLGLVVFFDDYANTLLLGNTMRPVTDRLKISREKLAYIVDSTAAPIAGLALISTWVAMLISQVDIGFQVINRDLAEPLKINQFHLVVQSIPYRFYVIFAVVFVFLVAFFRRDFGPMLAAEQRAADGLPPEDVVELENEAEPTSRLWYNAVLPIISLIGFTVLFLMTTGYKAAVADEVQPTFFNVFSRGDSYIALVYGSLFGLITAAILPTMQNKMSPAKIFDAAWSGVKTVVPAMAILWLAWSLSELTSSDNLGTQDYLAALLTVEEQPEWCPTWLFIVYGNVTSVVWLPTAIFLLSSFVSFATGTAWGTMGIMAPMVIKVTYDLTTLQLGDCPPDHPLMLAAIGSVIAGSIFGDHCSPISDTTVLSSQASGCNHIAHVRTQIPYAFLVGAISIAFGTLPVGILAYNEQIFPIGIVLAISIFLGIASMLCCLLIFGRRTVEREFVNIS